MKLCKNCRHVELRVAADYSKCKHPKAAKAHPVTGELGFKFCQTMRLFEVDCGEDGKLFEAATAQAAE